MSAISLFLKVPGVGPRVVPEAIRQSQNGDSARILSHLKNIISDPGGLLGGASDLVRQRLWYGRTRPRLFVINQHGNYPLRFHSEQFPRVQNGIRLSSEKDWTGLHRAIIEFSFSPQEMAGIITAHKILDHGLRRLGMGEIIYNDPEGPLDPAAQLQHLALDGLHQIGLTRMAENATAGVVDANCKVFDFCNLFVAGSSTFPTSGQAAPTLPAVTLAVRLAEHIANCMTSKLRPYQVNTTLEPVVRQRPLRVLIVTASYYPAVRYGGPIYTVHSLARALVQRGHHVVVYTTNVDGDQRLEVPTEGFKLLDGVEVHYFPSPFAKIYWSPEMIRALNANARNFDIVHAHAAFLYPTVAARRAARRARIPFVYSPRGMLVYDLIKRKSVFGKSLWILLFEIANIRSAAFVHATSELEADDIRKLMLKPKRIEVIPNGVDLPNAPPESTRGTHSPTNSEPYVLILGRVNWKKGIDRLIRAMSFVPSVKLAIVGNDEENYTAQLETIVRECKLEGRVIFAGPAYGLDKLDWMRRAEIFILPSYSENFGVVVLEAMACGRPVIMTPEVGIADEIQRTGAGLMVRGDPAQLGAVINSLLADPDRRKRMGEIGMAVTRDKYSWTAIAAKMEAGYHRCL